MDTVASAGVNDRAGPGDSAACICDLEYDLSDGYLSSMVGHGDRGPIDAGDREYRSSLRPDSRLPIAERPGCTGICFER